MKTVTVKGTIIIPGVYGDFWYYLLEPYTFSQQREMDAHKYVDEDCHFFHVASDGGRDFPLVVKGPYVLNFASAGKEIQIKDKEERAFYFEWERK